jgi:hypothetical protein
VVVADRTRTRNRNCANDVPALVRPGLAWHCPVCKWQYESPRPILGMSHRCGGQSRSLVDSGQEGLCD